MGELGKTTDIVQSILRQDAATRDSDSLLYCKVLERYGRKLGVDFTRVSVDSFFRSYKKYNIPSVETVGRCRRKLQEEYPELRGSEATEAQRGAREKQFRHYARN